MYGVGKKRVRRFENIGRSFRVRTRLGTLLYKTYKGSSGVKGANKKRGTQDQEASRRASHVHSERLQGFMCQSRGEKQVDGRERTRECHGNGEGKSRKILRREKVKRA